MRGLAITYAQTQHKLVLLAKQYRQKEEAINQYAESPNRSKSDLLLMTLYIPILMSLKRCNDTGYFELVNDQTQAGITGLITTIERYNKAKHGPFISYATKCVKHIITDTYKNHLSVVNHRKACLRIETDTLYDEAQYTTPSVLDELIKKENGQECLTNQSIADKLFELKMKGINWETLANQSGLSVEATQKAWHKLCAQFNRSAFGATASSRILMTPEIGVYFSNTRMRKGLSLDQVTEKLAEIFKEKGIAQSAKSAVTQLHLKRPSKNQISFNRAAYEALEELYSQHPDVYAIPEDSLFHTLKRHTEVQRLTQSDFIGLIRRHDKETPWEKLISYYQNLQELKGSVPLSIAQIFVPECK